MTTIGNIINTHTGPARVVVMLPAAAKADQQSYSQALTQAVAGGLVSVPGVTTPANSQQPGSQTPSSSSDTPAISTSAAVQSVFVEHPQAMGAPEMSANVGGDQGQSGTSSGDDADASSQDDGQTGDQTGNRSAKAEQTKTKWEPTGLAKASAAYRHTGKIASDHSAKLDISG